MAGTDFSSCSRYGRRIAAGMHWSDESEHVERPVRHHVSRSFLSILVFQTGSDACLPISLPFSAALAATEATQALDFKGAGAHVCFAGVIVGLSRCLFS